MNDAQEKKLFFRNIEISELLYRIRMKFPAFFLDDGAVSPE